MKFKNLDLLIILISLFIFQSCKNPDDLGLELQDNSGLGGNFTDTTSILSHIIKDDSLVTSNLSRYLTGDFSDPVFGRTTSSITAHALLSKEDVNFGTSLSLDSVVLVLGYVSDATVRFYGDTSSTFQTNIYRINEKISADSVYYSNKVISYDPAMIGSATYKAKPNDSLIIQNIRAGLPDTITKVAPQLRIKLNDAFGQELLSKSGSQELRSNVFFLDYLKGLHIVTTKVSGDGGIMAFDLTNSGRAAIMLYYKTATDTSNFAFNINSGSARIMHYTHDYTGTVISQQLADTTLGQNQLYIQPLAGLRAKIAFPHLKHLQDSGLVSVNKAEMFIKIEGGSDASLAVIPAVILLGENADGSEFIISQANYDATNKQYKIELTRTIQDLMNGVLDVKAIYLEGRNKQILANRSIVGGASNASYQMKLNIRYTKLY
jgi:hypothetical protein